MGLARQARDKKTYMMYHKQTHVMGQSFGGIARCYRKADPNANLDACSPTYDPTTDPLNALPSSTCSKYRVWNEWLCTPYYYPPWWGATRPFFPCTQSPCYYFMAHRPLVKCGAICVGWLVGTSAKMPWTRGFSGLVKPASHLFAPLRG